ncbi:hypothetical protein [Streptomyces boninensis]|uniref:hypothetical protein n=1 Tax=Streptomyces boninensis TaxID=2039455 RepID=UPI003B21E931
MERPRLSTADLIAYHVQLSELADSADPGPAAPGGWEQRERLRVSTWVRHAYDNPLSPAVFSAPAGEAVRELQRSLAAGLADRMSGTGHGTMPSAEVRAMAAVGAMWAITTEALLREDRLPRERLVREVWALVRQTIAPPERPGPRFVRARGSW